MSLTQVPLVCDKLGPRCREYLDTGNCRHWHDRSTHLPALRALAIH